MVAARYRQLTVGLDAGYGQGPKLVAVMVMGRLSGYHACLPAVPQCLTARLSGPGCNRAMEGIVIHRQRMSMLCR
jgi:hypothetical protein